MYLLQRTLLIGKTFLVVRGKLLVLSDLFLKLCNVGLQGWFLQCLCLLVLVDLLLRDELIERLSGILCNNTVDFRGGVL